MKMWDECRGCESIDECPTAVQPGSLMCLSKRMSNRQTKGQQIKAADGYTPTLGGNCRICGNPLRIIGTQRFCNNLNCLNIFVEV